MRQAPPLPALGQPRRRDSGSGPGGRAAGAERAAAAAVPRAERSSPPRPSPSASRRRRRRLGGLREPVGVGPRPSPDTPEPGPLPFPASLPLSPRGPVRGPGRSLLQVGGKFGGAGSPEVQVRRAGDWEGGVRVGEGRRRPPREPWAPGEREPRRPCSLGGRRRTQASRSRSRLGRRSLSSDKKRGFRVWDDGLGVGDRGWQFPCRVPSSSRVLGRRGGSRVLTSPGAPPAGVAD